MFSDIPYFKDYQIKNIKLNDNNYIISKYIGNGQSVYETIIPVTEKNYEDLKEEYYNTLSIYLKSNKNKFLKLNNSFDLYRNINIKKNKKRLKFGLGCIILALIGIPLHHIIIFLLSILLGIIGSILFVYNYDIIHKYKKIMENKLYVEEYENLNNMYLQYLNQKKHIKHNQKEQNIKPISDYCEILEPKKTRKIIKKK